MIAIRSTVNGTWQPNQPEGRVARYGVMCGVDGLVIDDGTVLRLAEDRFLVLTTTGGAASSARSSRGGCLERGVRLHDLA